MSNKSKNLNSARIRRHRHRTGIELPTFRLTPEQQAERDKLIEAERVRVERERPKSQ